MLPIHKLIRHLIKFGFLVFILFMAFQNCGKVEVSKSPDWDSLRPEVTPPASKTSFDNQIISKDNLSCNVIAGEAKCWGAFQLQNVKPLPDSLRPQKIPILSYKIQSIVKGAFHMCVLSQAGGVQCWGINSSSLGTEWDLRNSETPVDVQGLTSGVKQLVSGSQHNCVLMSTGAVKCWGLGIQNGLPVDIPGLTSGVLVISAGSGHTCALLNTGGIKCWGRNDYGQLGNGTIDTTSTFSLNTTDVLGLTSGVQAISAGEFSTCALTSAGGVKCWGNNTSGHIGNNTVFTKSPVPVDLEGLTSGVQAISSGGIITCALLLNNTVKCRKSNTTTTLIENSLPIESMSVGWAHGCLLHKDGKTKCWGYNGYGQLGNNSQTDTQTPLLISE